MVAFVISYLLWPFGGSTDILYYFKLIWWTGVHLVTLSLIFTLAALLLWQKYLVVMHANLNMLFGKAQIIWWKFISSIRSCSSGLFWRKLSYVIASSLANHLESMLSDTNETHPKCCQTKVHYGFGWMLKTEMLMVDPQQWLLHLLNCLWTSTSARCLRTFCCFWLFLSHCHCKSFHSKRGEVDWL